MAFADSTTRGRKTTSMIAVASVARGQRYIPMTVALSTVGGPPR